MSSGTTMETCPNCGHSVQESDVYCPSCGQKQGEVILTFKEMVLDALGAFFSFDSKAIRSIPKLLFHPGKLTLEYVQGKQQTYLAPFRFYLFVSIVLFLLLPLVVNDGQLFKTPITGPDQAARDTLQRERRPTAGMVLDSVFRAVREELDSAVQVSGDRNDEGINWSITRKNPSEPLIQFDTGDSSLGSAWSKAVQLAENGMPADQAIDSIFRQQKPVIQKFMAQGLKLQTRKGEGLMSTFLKTTSYALFLFLPLYALVLKLLYIRRKRYYMEHLVFSLHYFTFFFILICVYILIYRFAVHFPFWIIWVVSLLYLYAAMLRFYGQRWGRTLWKWIGLNFATTAVFLPVFLTMAVIISLLFY